MSLHKGTCIPSFNSIALTVTKRALLTDDGRRRRTTTTDDGRHGIG
ncbi:hypothetical protein [Bartonella sp. CL27QHWL]